jgi:Zn-dependent protease
MLEILISIVILFFSVIFHEVAHGWVAFRLGDPTARLYGRLTLNPFKHIDPLGTFVVPLALKFMGFFPIGWAKPVPINYANLKNPRRDMMLVALAGPATNISLALVASFLLAFPFELVVKDILSSIILVNLLLALFNLIPIPPLDGSRIVMGLLPARFAKAYAQLESFGLIIVLVLLNFRLFDFLWVYVVRLAGLLGVDILRM